MAEGIGPVENEIIEILIKSGRGNRPSEARQPRCFSKTEKVLNPTELDQVAACIKAILKDEERSVIRLLTSLLERRGFFLCSGGICIYKT